LGVENPQAIAWSNVESLDGYEGAAVVAAELNAGCDIEKPPQGMFSSRDGYKRSAAWFTISPRL
jgi:hypothetical protein